MSKPMRHVLRNCALFVNGVDYLGQVESLTLPKLTVKTEEIRAAGMAMPIEVALGYEAPEFQFKCPTVDPTLIAQAGLQIGVTLPFLATGAIADETGAVQNASCMMRGFVKELDMGDWQPGEKSETSFMVSVREYALTIAGAPIIAVTPYDVTIGGVSQTAGVRSALLA